MGLIACSLLVGVPTVSALWLWVRPLLDDRRRTSGWFLATAALCAVAAAVTWFVGAFSGTSLDVAESCHSADTTYDEDYRATHWREPSRFFPLHNRCNADHDLVPVWVNPTFALLVGLAITCVGVAVWLAVAHRLKKRGTDS
ncbi:hypothetical protein WEI85_26105 [Actinomycetes bacterium KLBMP 9797]